MSDSPNPLAVLTAALETAQVTSLEDGPEREAAWSAVATALAAAEAALAALRRALNSEPNDKRLGGAPLPPDLQEKLMRDGRLEWNDTIYYRSYEDYCFD